MRTLKAKKVKNEITLTYHVRESRFSRDFYVALFIAILFHVSLGTIFRIKESGQSHVGVFLPFTQVVAEVEKGSTVALLSQEDSLLPWSENSSPQVPDITASKLTFSHSSNDLKIDFSLQEKLQLSELMQNMDIFYD